MTRLMITLTILLATIAVAGCETTGSHPGHGVAYRQQLMGQQVTPGYAPATPVTGLDGRQAERTVNGYRTPKSAASGQKVTLSLGTVSGNDK
ncbi:hypothetical protein GGQ74_000897 [Desulfobaculum xiamenense]|uniref:Lipoprotein n=1 Tax=Desulfobaculum xiamenense TaxID=995050 RepID=A0A846QJI8_9BACT|nr:hypothetical protein [Desulfobaculum xiamenense]NJB67257.1 hypothetical protein [Desulfobaculum xiamenense]